MTTPITWTRITREHDVRNVRLRHNDVTGERDGHTVAMLTRATDGRWHIWREIAGQWMDVGDYHALARAKRAVETIVAHFDYPNG